MACSPEYDFEPITRRAMAVVLTSDLILAGMPLAVGFLYLWLYTSSLALALSGVLQLAFAWPCALFFYRYIFWLQHVENLTLLAAPLTAAFSLDAMALLVDAWHSSTVQPVRHEKSICFPCTWSALPAAPLPPAAGARSLVAARAARLGDPRRRHRRFPFGGGRRRCFAGSGLSPLLNVAHLGLFCAIQLTVQLLLALCLLPACLVLYHITGSSRSRIWCACACLRRGFLTGLQARSGEGWRRCRQGDLVRLGLADLAAPRADVNRAPPRHSDDRGDAPGTATAAIPSQGFSHLAAAASSAGGFCRSSRIQSPRALLLLFFALLTSPSDSALEARPSPKSPSNACRRATAAAYSSHDRAQFSPIVAGATVAATLLWGVAGVARGGSDDGGNRWSVDLVRNSSFYGEIEWRDAEAFVFDATAQEHVHAACSLLRRRGLGAARPRAGHCRGRRRRSMFRRRVAHVAQQRIDAPQPFVRVWSFPNRGRADGGPSRCVLSSNSDRQRGARWGRHVGIFRGELKFVAVPFALTLRPSASRWQAFRMPEPTPTLPVLTRTAPAGRPRRVSRGCRTSRRLSPRWHLPPSARLSTRHPGFGCGPALRLCCLMKRSSAPRAPPRSRSRCS